EGRFRNHPAISAGITVPLLMLSTMCPDIVFARPPVILTCGIVTALLGFILIKIEFHSHPLSVGSHAKKGIGYPMRVLISIVPSYTTQIPYEAFTDLRVPDRVTFACPALSSSRSAAQQGHFSACTNILATHDDAILRSCSAAGVRQPESIIYRKIVIASQLKLVVLQQLRAMNVAPHALFPT